jgi:hypothetical protein
VKADKFRDKKTKEEEKFIFFAALKICRLDKIFGFFPSVKPAQNEEEQSRKMRRPQLIA